MSHHLRDQLLRMIDETPLPVERNLTPEAKERYDEGKAILNTYRGQPEILIEATGQFFKTGSRVYACVGIAEVLATCAFLHDDEYDAEGLAEALDRAEYAEDLAPDFPQLKLIRVDIYLNMKRLDDAWELLDSLRPALGDTYDFAA